jgi:hypothetical protein
VQKEAADEIARFASSDVAHHRAWARQRQQVDAVLLAGKTRLTYDVQPFRLGADAPLYFVRAEWRAGVSPAFGAAVWVKGSRPLSVVQTDLSPARWLRMFEFQGELSRELYGLVLNVFDRDGDGWGEILFAHGGYEGMGLEVLEYSPNGFLPADISYSYGC